MKYLFKSKWTSLKKRNGWMHYEVLNVFKKQGLVEMPCLCNKTITTKIKIKDLKDKTKWVVGWSGKKEN